MTTITPQRGYLKKCILTLLHSMRLLTDLDRHWLLPELYMPVLQAMEVRYIMNYELAVIPLMIYFFCFRPTPCDTPPTHPSHMNNYIVRSYRDVIVLTKIATMKTVKHRE